MLPYIAYMDPMGHELNQEQWWGGGTFPVEKVTELGDLQVIAPRNPAHM